MVDYQTRGTHPKHWCTKFMIQWQREDIPVWEKSANLWQFEARLGEFMRQQTSRAASNTVGGGCQDQGN